MSPDAFVTYVPDRSTLALSRAQPVKVSIAQNTARAARVSYC
jgi:hypothetical protein